MSYKMWISGFGAVPPGRSSNLTGGSSADVNLGQGCGTDLEPQCLEANRQAICSPRVWRLGALCQLHQGPAYRLAKRLCPAGCGSTTQLLGDTPVVSDGGLSRGHLERVLVLCPHVGSRQQGWRSCWLLIMPSKLKGRNDQKQGEGNKNQTKPHGTIAGRLSGV